MFFFCALLTPSPNIDADSNLFEDFNMAYPPPSVNSLRSASSSETRLPPAYRASMAQQAYLPQEPMRVSPKNPHELPVNIQVSLHY